MVLSRCAYGFTVFRRKISDELATLCWFKWLQTMLHFHFSIYQRISLDYSGFLVWLRVIIFILWMAALCQGFPVLLRVLVVTVFAMNEIESCLCFSHCSWLYLLSFSLRFTDLKLYSSFRCSVSKSDFGHIVGSFKHVKVFYTHT